MKIKLFAFPAFALIASLAASAQTTKRIPLTSSQNPTNADIPFSQAVWVGDTLYVSGWLDPDLKTHTDTKSQTVGILADMQRFLLSQNLTLADVVMVREYWPSDPARDSQADNQGVRAGYSRFFGTKDQPNKPACTAVQVVLPSAARGALVEIDAIAVRPRRSSTRRIPLTRSQNPTNAELPFSQAVWAKDTLYVSGWLDPDLKTHSDMKSQTVGILEDLQTFLLSQNLTLGDVVMMREFLQTDPARDSKADILGARAGYAQFFGTRDQPNKPASTALQVVLPSSARGALIEIDFVIARDKP